MIDELFELTTGMDGLIVTLRRDNRFNEEIYSAIKDKLVSLIAEWKMQQMIPVKAVLAIFELADCLAGGSRFLDEKTAIRVEDVSLEIRDMISELYQIL